MSPDLLTHGSYSIGRFLFYRGLFLTYLLAFIVAYRQFQPLAGETGLRPFTDWLDQRTLWEAPSLLHSFSSDRAVTVLSVVGMIASTAGLLGIEFAGTIPTVICLLVLYVCYLSLSEAGNLFYGYGWESLLLETGFFALFLGGAQLVVSPVMTWLAAWLLFRVMFGAGLIKLRGDDCWWELTCMDYHYETQPMPNPVSWFAHHLPGWWHKIEVAGNHVVELIVPFMLFLPQPICGIGAVIIVLFQGWLMLTGNFSWLNFLTGVIVLLLIPNSLISTIAAVPSLAGPVPIGYQIGIYGYGLVVLVLSYYPAKNLLSERQLMNAGFDPLKLVNTYGAFGSITKTRYELVVQGRTADGEWRTIEFKGKPTDPDRCPPQWAPYHLRLDWQLWFAAMRSRPRYWLYPMLLKFLQQDPQLLSLVHEYPFDEPPEAMRIERYRYEFTDPGAAGWWNRERVGTLIGPKTASELRARL